MRKNIGRRLKLSNRSRVPVGPGRYKTRQEKRRKSSLAPWQISHNNYTTSQGRIDRAVGWWSGQSVAHSCSVWIFQNEFVLSFWPWSVCFSSSSPVFCPNQEPMTATHRLLTPIFPNSYLTRDSRLSMIKNVVHSYTTLWQDDLSRSLINLWWKKSCGVTIQTESLLKNFLHNTAYFLGFYRHSLVHGLFTFLIIQSC